MMNSLKRNLHNIEIIEKDIKRVLTKTTWDKTIEIQGYMMTEMSNGDIEYRYMPKPLQKKVIDYMNMHPRSRLAKSYVKDRNIRFRNKGYAKPENCSFNRLDSTLKNALGMNYVEPDFRLLAEEHLQVAEYDFSRKSYGYDLLKRFIHDNPSNIVSKCNPMGSDVRKVYSFSLRV